MTTPAIRSAEGESDAVESDSAQPPRKWQVRWSIRTLMLVSAVVCVWSVAIQYRLANPKLRSRIEALQRLESKLDVDDLTQIAAAPRRKSWFDESIWDLYVPPGQTATLHLATRSIPMDDELVVDTTSTALGEGKHTFELIIEELDEQWSIRVELGGKVLLERTEPLDWNPKNSSSGGIAHRRTKQTDARSGILELFRRRFRQKTANGVWRDTVEPTNGVLLWLERSEASPN